MLERAGKLLRYKMTSYDHRQALYALELNLRMGIPEEQTALAIARDCGKEAEMRAELENKKEKKALSIYRRHGGSVISILERVCNSVTTLEQELTLDAHAAENGKKKAQDKWIKSWNKIDDGRVMASMGDLYVNFKIIKRMSEQGTPEEQAKAKSLLFNLREDFDWSGKYNWLISSTRLIYSGTSLDTRIVQHYQCKKPELTKEAVLEVPVYRGMPVETMVSGQKGLAYLQALFDTEDDAETILRTLEFVSGKRGTDLVGWTANTTTSDTQYTRVSHPERASGFAYDDGEFRVGGCSSLNYAGRSRGVRCEP